jgi:hypothetical protein
LKHRFEFGQKVIVDNDRDNSMIVIGVWYKPEGAVEFDCAYWFNGDHKSLWMPSWRLTAAEI